MRERRQPEPTPTPMRYEEPSRTRTEQLRRDFVVGIVVLVPFALTVWLALWIFRFLDNLLGAAVRPFIPFAAPGLGIVLLAVLIWGVGSFARSETGARAILWMDRHIQHLPIASWVYGTATRITHSTYEAKSGTFRRCVLIEYPRKRCWTLAFVTADAPDRLRERADVEDLIAVFLPTTPNPTSGFLLFLPDSDVVDLDIPIEAGFRLVITAGAVYITGEDPREARRELAEFLARL